MLDTNIAIEIGNLNPPVAERFAVHAGACCLSVLSVLELQRGIALRPDFAKEREKRLRALLDVIPVVPFDLQSAEAYGRIIAALGWVRGRDFDRMIAAHAISAGATLITANEADFRDVPGLKIENWAD